MYSKCVSLIFVQSRLAVNSEKEVLGFGSGMIFFKSLNQHKFAGYIHFLISPDTPPPPPPPLSLSLSLSLPLSL